MAIEPLLATRAQRAFIATQAVVVLVMVGITFRMVEEHISFTSGYKTLPCYLALFALAEVFEMFMAFDALRLRSIIQLVGIILFHLALIVSAALQVHQTKDALVNGLGNCNDPNSSTFFINCDAPGTLWRKILPFLVVTPCVIAASWLVILFWVKELYAEFGWAIFHIVGANPKTKTMYQYYQVEICLLKFDFFFFTGVTMQLLIVVLSRNSAEFGVTIAAIPIVLGLLMGAAMAVRREIKWLMSLSLVVCAGPRELCVRLSVYKLVRFYEPASRDQYITTRATLTVFTIVAFLLLFATFAVGLRCFSDFDRGLISSKVHDVNKRPKYSKSDSAGNMSQRQSSYTGGSVLAPRISIE
ncbi:hypothetical protein GYMLUDRAFT_168967 [Collybiopsis luxurians FD-317 M1]|uniref:Uncharacterized protein n=1 Tax=Collybiopsis luxurians FD-317 M1 TaxID=944289 RepID=A0A0D0CVA2_9AGAR|nr:hypothetical protein GYMLUDRAFT_168967 [Collybiopsis luxurians FD-317 M1]